MKERPILFSGPMVRAILDGTKTQTRRLVKQPAPDGAESVGMMLTSNREARGHGMCWWMDSKDLMDASTIGDEFFCPYGVPGDRLWVRETFASFKGSSRPSTPSEAEYAVLLDGTQIYRDGEVFAPLAQYAEGSFDHIKWRPSIHMPRWASRLTLEITRVYAERLQEISAEDARAEGVTTSVLAELLLPLASRAKPQPQHWITGSDESDSYCRPCAMKEIERLTLSGHEAELDGGWPTEEDGARFCATCHAHLDVHLTDYGVDQELEYALTDGITEPEHAYDVLGAIDGGHSWSGEAQGDLALRVAYRHLWDTINGKRAPWASNPWVWVVEFEVIPFTATAESK